MSEPRSAARAPRPAQLLEAVLLVSSRPTRPADLRSATGLTEKEADIALSELQERYSPEASGIVLRNVAGGFLLSTNPACSAAVERFRQEARPSALSAAAHEVLACALYLGPLTRGGISRVRGVNSDAVVRNLLDRRLLVEVDTNRAAPGSPALLAVTEEFLAATGASSAEDFPALRELVAPEELARVRERLTSSIGGDPSSPDAEVP